MSKVRVVMNHSGAEALLKSSAVGGLMLKHARDIAGRAGRGFEASTWMGDSRVIGSVKADTIPAMIENARHNTLLRALGGGTGRVQYTRKDGTNRWASEAQVRAWTRGRKS